MAKIKCSLRKKKNQKSLILAFDFDDANVVLQYFFMPIFKTSPYFFLHSNSIHQLVSKKTKHRLLLFFLACGWHWPFCRWPCRKAFIWSCGWSHFWMFARPTIPNLKKRRSILVWKQHSAFGIFQRYVV